MRRINDPFVLRDCLDRLSNGRLTPAQARLVLAARGIRATQKALEQALQLQLAGLGAPATQQVATRRVPLKPLDDLPLTPEERAIMERLRRERKRSSLTSGQ